MNLYIIGIIVFSLVLIICIFLLIYFIRDEKKIEEVSNRELISFGKTYSKTEFEERIFNQYINILESTQYDNYTFLRDAVSDGIYNQILLSIKENQQKQQKNVISDIEKYFCRLIDFKIIGELEVAKLWVKYSSIEYVKNVKQNGDEIVIMGNKDKPIDCEYILTFVKNKSDGENIICPSCGFQTNMLISSRCLRCEGEVVPKTMHWVFVGKESYNK